MLFRPLLPWCFPIREVSFEQKESQEQEQQQQEETGGKSIVSAAAAGGNRRKKWLKASFSMGFRSYIREFLGAILVLFRPSLPWCFPIREVPFEQKESQEQEQQQKETEGKSSQNLCFLWVSEVTFGSFWAQF